MFDNFKKVVLIFISCFFIGNVLSLFPLNAKEYEEDLTGKKCDSVKNGSIHGEKQTNYEGEKDFALRFELVKATTPAYIVLHKDEHSGVYAAAKDLQRDITKITGITPNIVHTLKAAAGKCVVIGSADCPGGKDLLESVGVSVSELSGKWELFKYEILNNTGGKDQVLAIAGSNVRGTIFGIYDFEHKHLDVDPLWFWADHEPPQKGELVFDERINFSSLKEPTWKYRGWTLNDHPQLIEWMESGIVQRTDYGRYMFAIHPEVFDRIYEAALRLKINMFTWYFVDADWQPDWEQMKRTVERGFFITQHQSEPLGANFGYWDSYWDNYNPDEKPEKPSYLLYPEKFKEFWTHYIKKWSELSPHVVWEVNFRGWADAAYTDPSLQEGGNQNELADIVSQALIDQTEIIKTYDKNPDLEMMTTLYGEVGKYYDMSLIKIPDDVTIGFSDAGMTGMSYSKKFWTEPRDTNRNYGQYFHTQYFGGGPQIAKCTPLDTYVKVNMDAMYERRDTQHMLLAMNELRNQQLEIRGISEMLWDFPNFNYREYLQRYCEEEFGAEVASDVAALYDLYYDKYPHEIRNDGFKVYPDYYKVMEPMFTINSNLLNIESGNTDGFVMNYRQYRKNIFEEGIKDLGEVLEKAKVLRASIPENRRYFYDYEFIDAIRLVRGIYKLGIAVNDAIGFLEQGDNAAALNALVDAQPLTQELYDAFSNQKNTDKWKYWCRSSTNKDFYLLYNLYQKARLKLETETMDPLTGIEPQRRPFRGNVVMHDPAKAGDAVYGAQGERHENSVWNGSLHSIVSIPLKGVFQINGVEKEGRWDWKRLVTDHGRNYSFALKGKAEVFVAVQQGIQLNWLEDQGFEKTGQILEVGNWSWPYRYQNRPPDQIHQFDIFTKSFTAGDVVLGENSEKGLPYIVFVKPGWYLYENFRKNGFNSHPQDWYIHENGGCVKIVDIPDYDGELRPSVFDLSTVPRYKPLDLRGLKLETTKMSDGPSVAEFQFKKPVTDDFTMDIRWKAGQNNHQTGFELIGNKAKIIEVNMTEQGKISVRTGNGKVQTIATYSAGKWYNLKLRVSLAKGTAIVDLQDDKLSVTSSGTLKLNGGFSSGPVEIIRLSHANGEHGNWILYNAISAYQN